MAHKLKKEMMREEEEQKPTAASIIARQVMKGGGSKSGKPGYGSKPAASKRHPITGSEGFERQERAVAGVKSEIARESKTKESPKRFMKQRKVIDVKKPKDDFSHLKL